MSTAEAGSTGRTAEQTLEILVSAVEANLRTERRHGNVIDLSEVEEGDVLVSADLHGHEANWAAILQAADLEANPKRHLILQEVCHGGVPYPSGGCRSHRMVEAVAELKARYPKRVHFILSNHELAELTEFPITKDGKLVSLAFRMGIARSYPGADDRIHAGLQAFIGSCPLGVILPGDVLVCHSCPEEVDVLGFDATIFERPWTVDDLTEGGPVYRLVWGRDYRRENAEGFMDCTGMNYFIHGHTPAPRGFNTPNERQLILDCSSRPASYALLPLGVPLDRMKIVDHVTVLQ